MEELKIGEIVIELFSGVEHQIISDKDTPYDGPTGEIYPNPGNDFVLSRLNLKENEFAAFVHSPKENLKLLDK